MVNCNFSKGYNFGTVGTSCSAFSSYVNNYYAIAMDIAILAISIFVIALINVISIIILLILISILLVILSIIREHEKAINETNYKSFSTLT